MKRIFSLLVFLPLMTIAQTPKTGSKTLPLIESITTDTIKGRYQETVFSYDRFNRLIRIVNRVGHLEKSKNAVNGRWVVDTTAIQKFGYVLDQKAPKYKKNISYESNGLGSKWIKSSETYYYIYEQGKRVKDSVVEEQISEGKMFKNSFITTYEQTDSSLKRLTDFSSRDRSSFYLDYLDFHENVIAEEIGFHQGNHGGETTNYTYTKFDDKINPFAQLNIAPMLTNEKISFSFEEKELIILNSLKCNGGTNINWHLFNKNNALQSTIKRDDTASPVKDINSFRYTYNQYNLPVYCTIYIKMVFSVYQGTDFKGGLLKHFTFRYKK
jgi:hypothetical protein